MLRGVSSLALLGFDPWDEREEEQVQGEAARAGESARRYREATLGVEYSVDTQPAGWAGACGCPCSYVS